MGWRNGQDTRYPIYTTEYWIYRNTFTLFGLWEVWKVEHRL